MKRYVLIACGVTDPVASLIGKDGGPFAVEGLLACLAQASTAVTTGHPSILPQKGFPWLASRS